VTLLLNREFVSTVKNYVWLPNIVKKCHKMRNLPTILLRLFEYVGLAS